mmetsp:Transcript_6722/g.19006  ORF Transcript_6722/g.19006 Transcript_6722/m.19006 type:complete len:283 (-) Transcript_6722:639-1487(-)
MATSRMRLMLGRMLPASISSLLSLPATARAAVSSMRSVTSGASEVTAPRPRPGKIKALLACDGSTVLPPGPCQTGNLVPLANTARPPVHWYASSAEHSALDSGLDSAMMMGRSALSATASMTSRLKAPGTLAAPTSAEGRTLRTMSSRVAPSPRPARGGWASAALPSVSPSRSVVTRPLLSTRKMRARASRSSRPWVSVSSRTSSSAAPRLACPEPKKRYCCWSRGRTPGWRRAPSREATTAAEVPWMSSLKVATPRSWKCRSTSNALAVPRSSQCTSSWGP